MATLEEALAAATVDDTSESKILVIDNDLRTITIPPGITILGVESDDGVHRLYFQMPKTYGEFDLSEFKVRVNYSNAKGEGDVYPVKDNAVEGEYITFSWLVERKAVRYKGNTSFVVCLKKVDESGTVVKEFNTTLARLPVLEGLETTEQILQQYPDALEAILVRLDKLEEAGTGSGSAGVGIKSIEKTGTSGLIDTYTITLTDGNTSTFTVTNGADGKSAYQYAVEGGYTGTENEFREKLAKEYAEPIYKVTMTASDTAPALDTGKKYIFPDMASLAYTLTPPADETESAIYWFIFGSPSDTATTVTHPEGVTVDGPTIAAGKRYEVSISDGLAIIKEWEAATA